MELFWRVAPWFSFSFSVGISIPAYRLEMTDKRCHFLGWQCAGLNETSYCSFPTPWTLSAKQMSKTHFRLGWGGEGKVTTGLTFLPPPHTAGATVQPPQPWHFAFRSAASVGTGGWYLVALQRDCFLLTWEMGSSSWPLAPKSQTNHTATALRLSVLNDWEAYAGGDGTKALALKCLRNQIIQILNLTSHYLSFV